MSEEGVVWRKAEILALAEELLDDDIKAIREFVAREVIKRMNVAYGMLTGVAIDTYPAGSLPIIATAIGGIRGAIKVIFPTECGASGFTLHYELVEAARTAEGLRVRVSIKDGEREYFIVEGVAHGA